MYTITLKKTSSMKPSILDQGSLSTFLKTIGEKPYRIAQITQAIFKGSVTSLNDITTLPEDLRIALNEYFCILPLSVASDQLSIDGTNKVLFKTQDNMSIESVLMRHKSSRLTLCISSQVGCPVKCVFCSTGTMGFKRNLTASEIVAQVLYFNQKLAPTDERVRNIVFMGMGEPLLNYDNVMSAVKDFIDQKKFGIGVRHVTISTSGVVPKIYQMIEEKIPVHLAVSLHAPNDALRTKIMPINNAYPLAQLIEALDKYNEKRDKRIFYEYVMLDGVNDLPIHAKELAHLIAHQLAHVNLIPYNPGGSWIDLKSSSRTKILAFQAEITKRNIPSTIRYTLGQDIDAACGQLAAKENTSSPKL